MVVGKECCHVACTLLSLKCRDARDKGDERGFWIPIRSSNPMIASICTLCVLSTSSQTRNAVIHMNHATDSRGQLNRLYRMGVLRNLDKRLLNRW